MFREQILVNLRFQHPEILHRYMMEVYRCSHSGSLGVGNQLIVEVYSGSYSGQPRRGEPSDLGLISGVFYADWGILRRFTQIYAD